MGCYYINFLNYYIYINNMNNFESYFYEKYIINKLKINLEIITIIKHIEYII